MPEMHLRQPQFVYSACGPFTRHKERIKELKRTGDTGYVYRNEFDKACFQHDSAYADHKDLINRTEVDKVLRDKANDINRMILRVLLVIQNMMAIKEV